MAEPLDWLGSPSSLFPPPITSGSKASVCSDPRVCCKGGGERVVYGGNHCLYHLPGLVPAPPDTPISTLTQLSMGIVGPDMEPLVPRCRGK